MGHALKVSDTIATSAASEGGRRVSSAYINVVAANLRKIFQADDVFKPWEIDAIVDSVVAVLRRDGTISKDKLTAELHSKGMTKDLASSLAAVLSH